MAVRSRCTVSVIIPAYNHEDYIEQALVSVIDQTHEFVEIIVVDDGSGDRTAAIAEEILHHCARPSRLIRQPNQGAHHAINTGLNAAGGEFLTILNSDDYYRKDRLATLVRVATEKARRILFSRVRHVGRDGESISAQHPMVDLYRASLTACRMFPTISFELLRYNFSITSGNLFFNRSLFDQIGSFRSFRLCHDWDFLLRSVIVEEPEFVDEALISYRVHGGNTILQEKEVDTVGSLETNRIRGGYLLLAEHPSNPLAPCFMNWGDYWIYFLHNFTNFNKTL